MSKTQSALLVSILLLLAIVLLGSHFWLKPAVEEGARDSITEALARQGLTPKNPIAVSFSPLSRTLRIDPIDLEKAPALTIESAHMGRSVVTLTWQGLIACSPLAELLLPKTGQVTVCEKALLEGLSLESKVVKLKATTLEAASASLSAEEIASIRKEEQASAPLPLKFSQFKIASMEAEGNDGTSMRFGPIAIENIGQTNIDALTITDLHMLNNEKEEIRIGSLEQKNIRVFSNEEWAAIAAELASPAKQTEVLLDLVFGDSPIVGETTIRDIMIRVNDTPATIGSVSLITKENQAEDTLKISHISFASSVFEEEAKTRLPLPKILHLGLELGLVKKEGKTRLLKTNVGVEELFDLRGEILCQLESLRNIPQQLVLSPLSDFRLTYADKSLLARTGCHLGPKGGEKEALLSSLPKASNPKEQEQLAKLTTFIEHPGELTIFSEKGKTLTPLQIMALPEDEVINLFALDVQPGAERIEEQIARVRSEE
ncbi:MAG: hypothetical protein K5657_07750 [Desulfovibrio sp.]|nr:hypothetical protein [Desulfovibrio sp.]